MSEISDDVYSELAVKLVDLINELLAADSGVNPSIDESELQGLCSRVKSARTGFPLKLDERPCQEVNRLGSVLLGPVFTSENHPWPVDDDGNPMAPLCQLNTAHSPRSIAGVDGLIQVWLTQISSTPNDALIRVIPSSDVNANSMTPVISHNAGINVFLPDAVEWLRNFHTEAKPSRKQYISAAALKLGYANADELSDSDWDKWILLAEEYGDKYGDDVDVSWQITGFEDVRLYCEKTEDQKRAIAGLVRLKEKLETEGTDSDARLISLLAKVCDAYKSWEDACGKAVYPCLFGTFDEIQYSAEERDTPFICFESIGSREWGDGGNAQVFYSKKVGFYFDWSCF